MRSRQRKTVSLEVDERQRVVLERNIAALPRDIGGELERTGSDLPALFYHPNASARVLALVMSAGFDVVKGKNENAEKKVSRAVEVFTLVTDDEVGRGHLEGLAEQLGNNTEAVLPLIHDTLIPFLSEKMGQVAVTKAKPKASAIVMPRAVEDGEELPGERRRNPKPVSAPEVSPKRSAPASPSNDEHVDEPAVEAAPAAVEQTKAPAEQTSRTTGSGPSAAEAAAAAAAALAAIEAPYEEVVEDDSAPRFDPDRDLSPADPRKRRRRSKAPEGFERMKPDQRPDLEMMNQDGEGDAEPTEDASPEAASTAPAELARASRHGSADDLVDLALVVAQQFLRRAKDLEFDGRVKLEMVLTPADGDRPPQRRRRRRRRRPGGGND